MTASLGCHYLLRTVFVGHTSQEMTLAGLVKTLDAVCAATPERDGGRS